MEKDDPLLCSKKPTTPLYVELAETSAIPHPTYVRPILILYSHLHIILPNGLFASGFPQKLPVHFSLLPHTCHFTCSFRPP